MKTRTLLIAAVMLVALSAAAFGQAVYTVSSTPVTTVIATGNAELTGNITFTATSGPSVAGTITLQYGGTNVNITAPWSAIFACSNAPGFVANAACPAGSGIIGTVGNPNYLGVDTTASVYSPGSLVIDVPVGLPAGTQFTIVGVRVQINGSGLTSLVATISANGNQITAGETNVTVINSTTGAGIAVGGVVSYTAAPPLTTNSVPGAPTVNTVTGGLSGTNLTISIKEGFGAAFTKGVGVRVTVSATPPKGVTFSFPMAATSYDVNGVAVNGNWVLASSASTTAATAAQVISSSSTSASSLQVFYYVGTDTAADAVNLEYLEIPVTLASVPGSETLPLPAVSFTYTVSLAPVQPAYNSSGVPAGLAPRFAALEVGPANLLTTAGSSTSLMMPYVSSGGGFDTGIAISNTTEDPGTTVLGFTAAVPNSGPITFYFFPQDNTKASFSYATSSTSPGSGLVTGTGNVQAGGVYVALLSQLLVAAGQPATFNGYVIAVTNFTNAHGIFTVSNFTTLAAYSAIMPVMSDRSVLPEK